MTGRQLLHYQIVQKIGEGGMGAVYQARDTHLDRFVAVKVLLPEVMSNPDRKRRFVQEAKAASALNHPNIIHIYDIASDGGVDFIAMEYVDGKTLDSLIGRKGLRLAETLKYAIQIADGLAKAHAAGIIHRDLKPANLMVNLDGVVKVLDFGLAKLTEADSVTDETAATETLHAPDDSGTQEGAVVGTIPYMSPEQAEGRKMDARCDIFAFGSVLYKMITGRRPFDGDSKISTLNRILHEDPKPPSQLSQDVPHDVEKIILRCLRKDPDRRFQTMADLRIALLDAQEESESGAGSRAAPVHRSGLRYWPVLILAMAAAAGLTWRLTRVGEPASIAVPKALTTDTGLTFFPAISRDGKLLAYASDRGDENNMDIWVQQMEGGQPIRLTTHEATDLQPDFSPDGTRIAFRSDRDGGGIYVKPSLGGGDERLLAERGNRPRFSNDGKWISYQVRLDRSTKVFIVPSTGGQPKQLAPDFQSAWDPVWSPDGKHLLIRSAHPTNPPSVPEWDWWVVPLDGGTPVRTGINKALKTEGSDNVQAGEWEGGFLYLHVGSDDHANIWRVPLSSTTFQMAGPPQRITSGTGAEQQPRLGPGGMVVFAALNGSVNFWSLPVDANQGKALGRIEQLTRDGSEGNDATVSRDGRKLAYTSLRAGNPELWMLDLETRKTSPVIATPEGAIPRRFSADGSDIFYGSVEGGKRVAYRVALTGGTPQKVCEDCCLYDVSSDDNRILSCDVPGGQSHGVVLVDSSAGRKTELFRHQQRTLGEPRFSPDERWIVFREDIGPSRSRLFVVPLRLDALIEEKDWIAVTDGTTADVSPQWSPDGNLLHFSSRRDGFTCIWAVRLNPATKHPAGDAFPVHHQHSEGRVMRFHPRITVARDKVLFRLLESRSNIWMVKLP